MSGIYLGDGFSGLNPSEYLDSSLSEAIFLKEIYSLLSTTPKVADSAGTKLERSVSRKLSEQNRSLGPSNLR